MKPRFRKIVISFLTGITLLNFSFSNFSSTNHNENSSQNSSNLQKQTYSDTEKVKNLSSKDLKKGVFSETEITNTLKANQASLPEFDDNLFESLISPLTSPSAEISIPNSEPSNVFESSAPPIEIGPTLGYQPPKIFGPIPDMSCPNNTRSSSCGDESSGNWGTGTPIPNFPSQKNEVSKPPTLHAWYKIDKSKVAPAYQEKYNKWLAINDQLNSDQSKESKKILTNPLNKLEIKKYYNLIKNGDYTLVKEAIKNAKKHDLNQYNDLNLSENWYQDFKKVKLYFNSENYLSQLFKNPVFIKYGNLPRYGEGFKTNYSFEKWMDVWAKLIISPNQSLPIYSKISLPYDLRKENVQFSDGYYLYSEYRSVALSLMNYENGKQLFKPEQTISSNQDSETMLDEYLGGFVSLPLLSNKKLTWDQFFDPSFLKANNVPLINTAQLFYENVDSESSTELDQIQINNLPDFLEFEKMQEGYRFLKDNLNTAFKFWNFGITKNGFQLFLNKFQSIINASENKYKAIFSQRKKQYLAEQEKNRLRIIKEEERKEKEFQRVLVEATQKFNELKPKIATNLAESTAEFIDIAIKETISLHQQNLIKYEKWMSKIDISLRKIIKKMNAVYGFAITSAVLTAATWAVATFFYVMLWIPQAIAATIQASTMTYFTNDSFNNYYGLKSDVESIRGEKAKIQMVINDEAKEIHKLKNKRNELKKGKKLQLLKAEIESGLNELILKEFQDYFKDEFKRDDLKFDTKFIINKVSTPPPRSIKIIINYFIQKFYEYIKKSKWFFSISDDFKNIGIDSFIVEFVDKNPIIKIVVSQNGDFNPIGLVKESSFKMKIQEWMKEKLPIIGYLFDFQIKTILEQIQNKIFMKITEKIAKWVSNIFGKKIVLKATSWANPVLSIISLIDDILTVFEVFVLNFILD